MASFARHPRIRSFGDAEAFLKGRDRRRLCYQTDVVRWTPDEVSRSSMADATEDPDTLRVIAVRHHDTDIVCYGSDGRVMLANDGWFSVTTKARINLFSPFTVYSEPGTGGAEWAVETRRWPGHDAARFAEGMISDRDLRWQEYKAYVFQRGLEHERALQRVTDRLRAWHDEQERQHIEAQAEAARYEASLLAFGETYDPEWDTEEVA